MRITVILHHSRIDDFRQGAPFKLVEILFHKGPGYSNGPVSPEIEEYNGITVHNGAQWPSPGINHNKGVHILIGHTFIFCIESPDGFLRRGKGSALAQDMGLPSLLHYVPVCIVAIHGYLHTTATGCDAIIHPPFLGDGLQFLPGRNNIIKGRLRSHIPAIQEGMHPKGCNRCLRTGVHHGKELVNMGMDIAVGEQAYEMDGSAFYTAINDLAPEITLENFAAFDGIVHQKSTLIKDPACAQGIVSNLTIAHVFVRRQPNRATMGLKLLIKTGMKEAIKGGGICQIDSICLITSANAYTVHDDKQEGSLSAVEGF